MTMAGLPPEGRELARAVTALVDAARRGDAAALRAACEQLRARDETVARDLLHRLTLGLVERAYPDGLDGDDVRGLFDEVIRQASPWLAGPGLDPYAVLVVLAGTLSVHPPDDAPRPSLAPDALPVACALVVDLLLARLGSRLPAELARAFDELRTAQTMEIP
ncbi:MULTISPECIES: hypothetical protein [Pseudofrankia]|uniref:hypothetical protein n=1 Tax=Pseudofrankia TaxID=2994363 RepID=UPI000234BF5A|nr:MULTISPECIES: hypothetical protein [Pseudofrankia]OHV32412.1 hypothetical protein BCD49_29625 [Pseudofrankia sp. EUN1h]